MRRTVFSKPCGASAAAAAALDFERRALRGVPKGLRAAAFSSPQCRRSEDARRRASRGGSRPRTVRFAERRSAKNSEFLLMRGANVHSASSRASASSRDVRCRRLNDALSVTAENANAGPAVSWLDAARARRARARTRARNEPRLLLLERRFSENAVWTKSVWTKSVSTRVSAGTCTPRLRARRARAPPTAASAAARFDKSRSATFEERPSFASLDAGVPRA